MSLPPPYETLTPDCLLTAVENLGLPASGSLLALNSYENRVYQLGMDDAPPLVVKFYRPARWTDAQIIEEHDFVAALAAEEIPVVAPMQINGQTLHHHAGFRFAVFPRRGGRTPELDDAAVLEWIGRFMGRIHAMGATRPFTSRPTV
ncbi:MAG: serine/threonine protein kinase, partial [Chitinimonas sp.]|nr:serine/threonine protein kinase [Chitinimonas sp.]